MELVSNEVVKKKVFISQPMNGKENEEIYAERKDIVAKLEAKGYEVVDSVFDDYAGSDVKNTPLYYLGKSIMLMSTCDCIFLFEGYRKARGCQIEAMCARNYGLEVIRPWGL